VTLAISSPSQWVDAFLGDLAGAQGLPAAQLQTPTNESVVGTWYASEGGNWHNAAHYNPLNTSLPEPGSTNYGTGAPGGGVQAYGSWEEGLTASVDTLLSGQSSYGYGSIVSDLDQSAPAPTTAKAIQSSAWDAGGYPGSSAIGQLAGGGAPTAASSTPATTDSATTAGLNANPFDLFGIPGSAASGVESAIGAMVAPLKAYLEDAGLVILGLVFLVVGLVVLAHSAMNAGQGGSKAPATPQPQTVKIEEELPSRGASGGSAAKASTSTPRAKAPQRPKQPTKLQSGPRPPANPSAAVTSAPSTEGAEVALAAA
jgi:hypothetical protein